MPTGSLLKTSTEKLPCAEICQKSYSKSVKNYRIGDVDLDIDLDLDLNVDVDLNIE